MTHTPAHIRHAGVMIDASFNRQGGVDYYVVQGSPGRFTTLDVAKEIAEAVARRHGERPLAPNRRRYLQARADGVASTDTRSQQWALRMGMIAWDPATRRLAITEKGREALEAEGARA